MWYTLTSMLWFGVFLGGEGFSFFLYDMQLNSEGFEIQVQQGATEMGWGLGCGCCDGG